MHVILSKCLAHQFHHLTEPGAIKELFYQLLLPYAGHGTLAPLFCFFGLLLLLPFFIVLPPLMSGL